MTSTFSSDRKWTEQSIGKAYLTMIGTIIFVGALVGLLRQLENLGINFGFSENMTLFQTFPLHNMLLLFFIAIPLIPAVVGNLFLGRMLKIKSMAYPRLNIFSCFLFGMSLLSALVAGFRFDETVNWTLSAPLGLESSEFMLSFVVAIFLAVIAMTLTAINFAVTIYIHWPSRSGLTGIPIFAFGMFIWSLVQAITAPVLAITLMLLIGDRVWRVGIFDPTMGGDPVLFRHFFWFAVHPMILSTVIPGITLMIQLFNDSAKQMIFGHRWIARSIVAFAVLIFLGWGQHFYFGGESESALGIFSFFGAMSLVPISIIGVNVLTNVFLSRPKFDALSIFTLSAFQFLLVGALAGFMLAMPAINMQLHGTRFIFGHVHYMIFGGIVIPFIAAMQLLAHGRKQGTVSRVASLLIAILIFVGVNMTCLSEIIIGMGGTPQYMDTIGARGDFLSSISSLGSILSVAGVIVLAAIFRFWTSRSLSK